MLKTLLPLPDFSSQSQQMSSVSSLLPQPGLFGVYIQYAQKVGYTKSGVIETFMCYL